MKRHPYILATVIATLLALVVWLCVPKEYTAITKVSDEYKETDLAIGMTSIKAQIKRAMGGDDIGMNDMTVYSKSLDSEDFARAISHKQVPGKNMTYGEYLGEKDTIEAIQDRLVWFFSSRQATLTISFSDHDPQVATQMLDSITDQLQTVVTNYRHFMAEALLQNAQQEMVAAKTDYDKARKAYGDFVDAHVNLSTKAMEQQEKFLAQESKDTYQRYEKAIEECARQKALTERAVLSFAVVQENVMPEKANNRLIGYLLCFVVIALLLTRGFLQWQKHPQQRAIRADWSTLFSPWTITFAIWTLIIGLYYLLDTKLSPITQQFYYSLGLWLFFFTICALVTYYLTASKGTENTGHYVIDINRQFFRFFFFLAIVMTPLYVYRILQIVMMFGTDDLMNNVRILALYGDSMGILNYSMVITQSLFVVALWAHPKVPTWQVVVLGIACLLNSLAIMEKGSMFFIFTSVVFVLFEKKIIKTRSIVMFGVILIIFFYIFNLGRAEEDSDYQKEETFLDFFAMYVLSPPVAFCQISKEVIPQFGTNTFEKIYVFLARIFSDIVVKEKLQEFVWVPIPTNVYTCFMPFFMDFGYKGVAFFGGIYGVICGWLYRMFRNRDAICCCLYTYMVFILVLQFYQENLFQSLVFILQYTFFIVLILQQKLRFVLTKQVRT